MRGNEHLRDAIALLKQHGITPEMPPSKKHIKIRWVDHRSGRTRTFVIAHTPSDYRSGLNNRAQLRRMLRENAR